MSKYFTKQCMTFIAHVARGHTGCGLPVMGCWTASMYAHRLPASRLRCRATPQPMSLATTATPMSDGVALRVT